MEACASSNQFQQCLIIHNQWIEASYATNWGAQGAERLEASSAEMSYTVMVLASIAALGLRFYLICNKKFKDFKV